MSSSDRHCRILARASTAHFRGWRFVTATSSPTDSSEQEEESPTLLGGKDTFLVSLGTMWEFGVNWEEVVAGVDDGIQGTGKGAPVSMFLSAFLVPTALLSNRPSKGYNSRNGRLNSFSKLSRQRNPSPDR